MRLSGQFQASLFFLQKDFVGTKMQNKPKPTYKNKNKQTKNNNGNNFLHTKTFEREKIVFV